MHHTAFDSSDIRQWILNWLANELRIPLPDIRSDENLLNYHMDSVNAIMLVGDLEDRLGLRLSPTLIWDHPTVDALVEALKKQVGIAVAEASEPSSASRSAPPTIGSDEIDEQQAQELLNRLDELSDDEVESLLNRLNRSSTNRR